MKNKNQLISMDAVLIEENVLLYFLKFLRHDILIIDEIIK